MSQISVVGEVQPEKELPGDIQAPMFKDIVSGIKREIKRGSVKSKGLWPNHGPKEEQLYGWHLFSSYSLSYLSQKKSKKFLSFLLADFSPLQTMCMSLHITCMHTYLQTHMHILPCAVIPSYISGFVMIVKSRILEDRSQ